MGKQLPMHIAVIGVDGSGKSSCYEGLLNRLTEGNKIAGIGDKVFITDSEGRLSTPHDIMRVKVKYTLSLLTKICKNKFFYEISKLTELVQRSKIHDAILKRYDPKYIITDGSPLINILGWGRYYHPQHFNEKEYERSIRYLTGQRKLSFREVIYYLKHIPELVVISKVYLAQLKIPDLIIFLKVSPQEAVRRIKERGRDIQVHEHENFLTKLQEAYIFTCGILRQKFDAKIFEIETDQLAPDEVLKKIQDVVVSCNELADINVIATTISGSFKDWGKLDRIEGQFKHYHDRVKVHIVDSHKQAFEKTKNIVMLGGRIIVSAGGAGTFNSVLEGCCSLGSLHRDLRLAFLRKGSADLIGKVLRIPDDLEAAVEIISEGIKTDRTIESDILEIKAKEVDGDWRKYHMIGFGGIGIFGSIPYFTESRLIKYYKGFLGYFLGDRGPFLTGANLAIFKHYFDKIKGKRMRFKIVADGIDIPHKSYSNILIMNGDMGKHFPVAKGVPLGSGDFQVILARDEGLIKTYQQLIHAWKGDLSEHKDILGTSIFRTKTLTIIPDTDSPYFLNVDGLLKQICGQVEYRLFEKVRLITG